MDRDKLIINNHNLIYRYAINNHLDIEEWYGVLAIALVKAADKFNEKFGVSFGTFAYKIMKNAVLREKIKFGRDSLSHSLTLSGYEDGVPLVEIIPNEDKNIFDVKLPKCLTEEEKEILIYKLCGFTNKDIEQITGINCVKITRTIGTIRYKWQQEKENEKFDR